MSNASIYLKLRAGGMTPAGAVAMMGNMSCESAMRSNNVQDGMGYSDDQYTSDVDNGRISRESFATDSRGYGLCQWTYHSRKRALYDFAVQLGSSIGDESMQVTFCLREFPSEAPDTFNLLKTSDDVRKCTEWICKYYERPAVNNIEDRYQAAMKFYMEFSSDPVSLPQEPENVTAPIPPSGEPTEVCTIVVRCLKKGDSGRDVLMAQCGLNDCGYSCGTPDGDYGPKTSNAVREFREACNLDQDGGIDQDAWQILFQ